jgi:hypothetical protein
LTQSRRGAEQRIDFAPTALESDERREYKSQMQQLLIFAPFVAFE